MREAGDRTETRTNTNTHKLCALQEGKAGSRMRIQLSIFLWYILLLKLHDKVAAESDMRFVFFVGKKTKRPSSSRPIGLTNATNTHIDTSAPAP